MQATISQMAHVGIIAASSLLCGCSGQTALVAPIRFEQGFSLTQHFRVAKASQYDLAVEFHKDTHVDIRTYPPPDEFTVEFAVRDGETVISAGTNESNERHPALLAKDFTARYLATFDARPDKTYNLSFRVVRALPALANTRPQVTIREKTYPPR
jgi:hypothetical protein